MKYYYEDFYGCKAVIETNRDGSANLRVYLPNGSKYIDKSYKAFGGAKKALGRYSEGTARLTGTEARIF